MGRVGKAGTVSSCGYTATSHQVATGPLQTEPKNIRPERNSRRLGENVHEARLRQASYASQGFSRKVIRNAELLAQVFEHKIYTRVDPPPDPRIIDMSPKGMMASTSRVMPTDRVRP